MRGWRGRGVGRVAGLVVDRLCGCGLGPDPALVAPAFHQSPEKTRIQSMVTTPNARRSNRLSEALPSMR